MQERKTCPLCGSGRLAPILYGKPLFTEELSGRLRREEVYLGGCMIPENAPKFHCFACGRNVGDPLCALQLPNEAPGWFRDRGIEKD